MLRLCLDDSGHEADQGEGAVFACAGYVASIEQWDAFEKEWNIALREANVEAFKMAHLQGARGFGEYWDWGKEKRNAFIERMAGTVDRHLRQGVGRAISVKDFHEQLVPAMGMFTDGTRVTNLGVVAWCMRMCLEWLGTEWHGRAGKRISVVFEAGTQGLSAAVKYCEDLIKAHSWGKAFDRITVKNKKGPDRLISLQTGDFLAGQVRQWAMTTRGASMEYQSRLSFQRGTVSLGYLHGDDIPAMLGDHAFQDRFFFTPPTRPR
jgi:hypothetical protein